MRIKLRYFAFLALALSCGTALLWVSRERDKPALQSVVAVIDESGPNPIAQPMPLQADSNEPTPGAGLPAADGAARETRTESILSGDCQAGLAMLDQLARDVANEVASPDEVFSAISGHVSAGTLDAAVRFLAGEKTASFGGFEALPSSFVAALAAALGRQGDHGAVARALDAAWRGTSDPVVRERLESLESPGLYAARVAEFASSGDTVAARKYLAQLETCGHSATPDYFAALAAQPGIDLKELSDAALNWASRFPDLANVPDLGAGVSDPTDSSAERLIAAAAFSDAAPGNPTGEPVPFPSSELPPPILPAAHIYDGPQQPGSMRFETMRPAYEAEGTPLSLLAEVVDQPKPGSAALPQQAVSPASLDLPPDLPGSTVSAADTVWRLMAHRAVHDTIAAELLVKSASKDEIPEQAWPGIADTLVGESLQEGRLIPVSSATLPAWTDEELNERLDLIEALLAVTTNRMARQAIQQAVVRLSEQLALSKTGSP